MTDPRAAGYDDEILITDLEENLADDPYGTATYVIRNVLHRALKADGLMNDHEVGILKTLQRLVTDD